MVLAKEDFKFSAAHFTLFADGRAELLHGHNYRVRVEVTGEELDGAGLLVDIEALKRRVRELCAILDNRTLIPGASSRLAWSDQGEAIEIRFERRVYRLPADDVLILPLSNTSIELLAEKLWHDLATGLAASGADTLAVAVEESPGQQCWYEAPLL